jgi:hypothetical protein
MEYFLHPTTVRGASSAYIASGQVDQLLAAAANVHASSNATRPYTHPLVPTQHHLDPPQPRWAGIGQDKHCSKQDLECRSYKQDACIDSAQACW